MKAFLKYTPIDREGEFPLYGSWPDSDRSLYRNKFFLCISICWGICVLHGSHLYFLNFWTEDDCFLAEEDSVETKGYMTKSFRALNFHGSEYFVVRW